MIYFTSDQHFGHTNIIKYSNRPFEYSYEGTLKCDEFIRDKYCSLVKEDDIVIFLGDVALFKNDEQDRICELIRSLPGQKLLLKGNHDNRNTNFYLSCGFLDVRYYLQFGDFFICHYPLTGEDEVNRRVVDLLKLFNDSKCTTLIHGHTHDKSPPSEKGIKRINVCVDNPQTDFSPVTVNGIPEKEMTEYFSKLFG